MRSVKLYGRVPVERIRTLALDEGSRTSAALARILLKERFGVSPETRPLPIGASLDDAPADAVLLIGDRGMLPTGGGFEFEWDLGEEWSRGRACRLCSRCGSPGRESICGESTRRWPRPATTASAGWTRLPGKRPREWEFPRPIAFRTCAII